MSVLLLGAGDGGGLGKVRATPTLRARRQDIVQTKGLQLAVYTKAKFSELRQSISIVQGVSMGALKSRRAYNIR